MAIIGNINKLEQFLSKQNLQIVFDYFRQALDRNSDVHQRILNLPVGSFEKVVLSEDVFALEQVFYTKKRETCFIESHKKYIDFQLILNGSEQMEMIDIDRLTIKMPYDELKDLMTYDTVDNTTKIVMQSGDLSVFFPDDAHMGQSLFEESCLVHKTVIKFPLSAY